MKSLKLIASVMVLVGCASSWGQELRGVALEAPSPLINTETGVLLSIAPREPNYCGLRLDWGDGTWADVRVDTATSQIRLSHLYPRAGSYTIKVEGRFLGRGLKSLSACDGRPQTLTFNVADPEVLRQQAGAERAAAQLRIDQEARRKAEAQLQEERLKAQMLQREIELERRERELALRERENQIRVEAEAKVRAEAREREEAEARKRREAAATRKPDPAAVTTPPYVPPAPAAPPKPPGGF